MGTGIAGINHAALYVNDLEAAKDFFVTYLGATSNDEYHNPTTNFRSYFLSFDGNTRLEIMTRPGMEDNAKPFRTHRLRTRRLQPGQHAGSR